MTYVIISYKTGSPKWLRDLDPVWVSDDYCNEAFHFSELDKVLEFYNEHSDKNKYWNVFEYHPDKLIKLGDNKTPR